MADHEPALSVWCRNPTVELTKSTGRSVRMWWGLKKEVWGHPTLDGNQLSLKTQSAMRHLSTMNEGQSLVRRVVQACSDSLFDSLDDSFLLQGHVPEHWHSWGWKPNSIFRASRLKSIVRKDADNLEATALIGASAVAWRADQCRTWDPPMGTHCPALRLINQMGDGS